MQGPGRAGELRREDLILRSRGSEVERVDRGAELSERRHGAARIESAAEKRHGGPIGPETARHTTAERLVRSSEHLLRGVARSGPVPAPVPLPARER